ncbi:MAG: AraC family transcriptional regulator [Vibrio sp.]
MNYAIESQARHFAHLALTARKRTLKHSLIRVEQGLLLFRLGKHEYAVEHAQTLWIPCDCLCGLTFFPDTRITRVDFSVRLSAPFTHQAGLVQLSPLVSVILDRLQDCPREQPAFAHLTQLLMLELIGCEPKLIHSPLTQALSQWQPEAPSGISKEHHLVLLVREALKRSQSGVATPRIIDQLFAGNAEQYQQLRSIILGQA